MLVNTPIIFVGNYLNDVVKISYRLLCNVGYILNTTYQRELTFIMSMKL